MYDVCIIGCGMSGMTAAIALAKEGKKVIIFEKNKKAGKKIYATGNGKCNISNTNMDIDKVYSSISDSTNTIVKSTINRDSYRMVKSFFGEIGVVTYTNESGYIYPASNQASSIVWAMLDELKKYNVNIEYNTTVIDIIPINESYQIHTSDNKNNSVQIINSRTVILACGGKSYPSLGGSDSGYKLLDALDIKYSKLYPALCGIKAKSTLFTASGVRVKAKATLINSSNETIAEENGELQITDYGFSGIMIYNLTPFIATLSNHNMDITLDLLPDYEIDELIKNYEIAKDRTLLGCLNGFMNDRLASALLTTLGFDKSISVKDIDKNVYFNILNLAKSYKVNFDSLCDYETAQITAGGVMLNEINPNTLESVKYNGLYIIGEQLDVNGICGGYNITFAIISALKVANVINA